MTDQPAPGLGNRIAPPRFIVFLLATVIAIAAATHFAGWAQATLIGFDVGATIFLLSCIPLLGRETDGMRASALRNDANRVVLLGITGVVCLVVLVAIAVELADKDRMQAPGIVLIVGTLLIAWLFSNLVYALHYAHLFYSPKAGGGDSGGIDFPGDGDPDYWDFIYFAFTLGMTFQTSDVEIAARPIRRVVIVHCFAAFVFNLGVLAFTINVLGGVRQILPELVSGRGTAKRWRGMRHLSAIARSLVLQYPSTILRMVPLPEQARGGTRQSRSAASPSPSIRHGSHAALCRAPRRR